MTAPEDQNGLREALARILDPHAFRYGEHDYYGPSFDKAADSARLRCALKMADALIAGPLASLIAERDAAVADALRATSVNADLCEIYNCLAVSAAAQQASLRAAEAEITRLKEGMEAALRPFARAADAYPISPVARRENRRQCEVIWSYGSEDNGNRREIAVSDLRNAAQALATLSPKEHPHG